MEELIIFGDQVKEALRQLGVVANKADNRLRDGMGVITEIVGKAIATLNRRIDQVAQDGPAVVRLPVRLPELLTPMLVLSTVCSRTCTTTSRSFAAP